MTRERELVAKRDKFSSARDGKSYLYDISCVGCEAVLFTYQKDAKGDLIRCYMDRILRVHNVKGIDLKKPDESMKDLNALVCGSCDTLLGTAMVYKPENRLAFQMLKGRYSRKPYKPSRD